ncbi:MAG: beta-propeller domain-containing protein [Candidatus Bathyarchaeota archaeon]
MRNNWFNLSFSKGWFTSFGNRFLLVALVGLILGGAFGGVMWHFGGVYIETRFGPIRRFSSYDELKNFLNEGTKRGSYTPNLDSTVLSAFNSAETPDYSETNVQVAGVDEADIVKTDGKYIYLVSGRNIFIVLAYPAEDSKILSKMELTRAISGIYVSGDKLIILQGRSGAYFYSYADVTSLTVYDISDRTKPVLSRNVTMDGSYLNSRMIGDYVYVIVSKYAYLFNGEVQLPTVYLEDRTMLVPASSIYYTNSSEYYHAFTTIMGLNVKSKQEPRYETLLLDASSIVYVSQSSIYITASTKSGDTSIHKINFQGGEISYVASGSVAGYVLNQYSMDEYNGGFRLATTKGFVSQSGASSQNNVYVLDESMKTVGRLENIAPGESIHSARFMGGRCYLVTFKKIDPFFVIDLTNPRNPQVLGELKIPGYSDYLHPWDENHLIGVGKETVEADSGNFAWYQGVKIALFDVTNVTAPKEVAKLEIGDRGTDSPALRDPKAFLFSASKHLIVLPILLAEINEGKYPQGVPPNAYGDYVWQGAYVLNASLESGLAVRGGITHLGNDTDLMRSGYYFSSSYSVKRALYIGEVLYTVSDKMIKMNNQESLMEINIMQLS